ncbi:hypothetical protein [Planctomicrobium sp. SH527]|uniref:hypothetical protein n=1 Tax=Planctomicrobium sp. SH527 TaxID=3448123 RepID=UPI003F5C974D
MTNRESDEHPVIDGLVLEHLERNAAQFDSSVFVHRILSEQSGAFAESCVTPQFAPHVCPDASASWRRVASWWGTAAIVVAVAFLCGRYFDNPTANAATVLQGVQSTHAKGIDYCYRVRFDPDPRTWNQNNKLEGPSLTRLWTRGDRFWSDCAIGDIQFKLGREANGSVWITGSREKGIRFSNQFENLPEIIVQICQINSMSVPQLMNQVLVDFDLNSRVSSDASGSKRTLVWAQLKPKRTHTLLSNALLEIDTRSNILVRLVLWTVKNGQPNGTVAFTLLESGTIDDSQYELDSHLAPGAPIEIQTLPSPDYQPEFNESPEAL